MAKLFVLLALFAVVDAKFGNVVFDLFGNIYKVTLPQQGTTPVTLAALAGPKTTQAAFNSLDFLKVFNPTASDAAATIAPIIPNPLSFLDIFKPKVPASGVSATPGAIPTTLPAYTTPNVPGVSTPSISTSDLPSVTPPASSDAPTVPGDQTTISPATTPTALPNIPHLPGTSTPSIGATDVPSISSPIIPIIPKNPGFGDLSTKLPAITPSALPTTSSIGSSDVPSVSPPASSNTPKVPGFDDLGSKPPGAIPNTVPTKLDLPKTSTPTIGSSDVPSVSPPASSGTPKVPGIDDLGSKQPSAIPNTVPTKLDLPKTSTPSIGSSGVPSVSLPASSGTPKGPGIDDLSSKPPGTIPSTVPSTPDLHETSTPLIGSSDIPSLTTPSTIPNIPGLDNSSPKLPDSITSTVPSTPDLPEKSTPSISSSDVPSSPLPPGIPKAPGFDDLSSKLPDAPTSKPSSLGGLPNSDSLTPAKGNGDLIGDAVNLFSGAAQNPFGRK